MGLPVRSLARGAHLFGRGGPPAGLPCGSQIPTYSSFGVRPHSARGGTWITMCRPAVRVRGHAGGGGVRGLLSVRPHFCLGGGGRGSKGLLPCFLVPKGNQPKACTLALWWLKFGPTEWGGGGGSRHDCTRMLQGRPTPATAPSLGARAVPRTAVQPKRGAARGLFSLGFTWGGTSPEGPGQCQNSVH